MSFCIASFLAACGGGGSGPITALPAPTTAPVVAQLVEWYGDSTGAGLDGTYMPRAWQDQIAAAALRAGAGRAFVEADPPHIHIERIALAAQTSGVTDTGLI